MTPKKRNMKPRQEPKHTFSVGDGVHWGAGTDTKAGTVVKVNKTGKTVWVVEDKVKLLNGVDSGEPDALKFYPGGFLGHTSGRQRYEFSPGDGEPRAFSLRSSTGRHKLKGTSINGSMSVWGNLSPGRAYHYDYNY
jgi:hypothetical protein